MGRTIFTEWTDRVARTGAPRRRGVHLPSGSADWETLVGRADDRARIIEPGSAWLVDPSAGLESFVSLLAVARTPDTALLWARAELAPFALEQRAPALFACATDPVETITRPLYATLTSASTGPAKIPVAYGDVLEAVALRYDGALYRGIFDDAHEVEVLATCLPMEYAATFMMVVVPALFLARDLVVFPPHRWDRVHAIAAREHVACLTVPALLAAATAATPRPLDMSRAAVVTTAGYLTRTRIDAIRGRFLDVRLLTSYGASETGVVTLDREPDGAGHVGRPLEGKPVWLVDEGPDGVGKIATAGDDCREFHWGAADAPLRRPDGSVAATDLGHFDDSGRLVLDGRLDHGLKLHGITIHPARIERHILSLDGVVDARVAVHDHGGIERLTARVVGSADAERVRAHCLSLPETARPSVIECLPEGTDAYDARGKL